MACFLLETLKEIRVGIRVKGPEGFFWQRFVYESLDGACFHCSHFHHVKATCMAGRGDGSPDLGLEYLVQEGGKEDGVVEGGPCLRLWLVAIRKSQLAIMGRKMTKVSWATGLDPNLD